MLTQPNCIATDHHQFYCYIWLSSLLYHQFPISSFWSYGFNTLVYLNLHDFSSRLRNVLWYFLLFCVSAHTSQLQLLPVWIKLLQILPIKLHFSLLFHLSKTKSKLLILFTVRKTNNLAYKKIKSQMKQWCWGYIREASRKRIAVFSLSTPHWC